MCRKDIERIVILNWRKMARYKLSTLLQVLLIFFLWAGISNGLEIHFEEKESGFFIRPPNNNIGQILTGFTPSLSLGSSSSSFEQQGSNSPDFQDPFMENSPEDSSATMTTHFTVLPSTQPVSIRVTYGPFSTKQTVPVRLLVPDPLDSDSSSTSLNGSLGSESEMIPPLDLSAHLVTPTVPKDNPILRVLFHAGQTGFGLPLSIVSNQKGPRQPQNYPGTSNNNKHRTRLCLVAQASKGQGDSVSASCSPDARDSTCLAELTLPIHWWPEGTAPLVVHSEDGNNSGIGTGNMPVKPTKVIIQVSYAVYEPENGHCNEIGLSTTYGEGIVGEGSGTKRIQIQPLTSLATAVLVNAQKFYRIVKADGSDAVQLLVPVSPLYPHAKFYVPVTVGKHDHHSIVAFIMRARVKSGLRIIGIEPNVDKMWNITTDFNPRRTHATITAVRKFDPRFQEIKGNVEEVFNWILEAAEEASDDWDGGRVVWILRYVVQPSSDNSWMKKDPFANFGDERHKLTTRLEIQKDDIQAVVPIAKSWEVINTAVLDGKQVSRPMKVFIVSRAGQVADVTLQASCKSLDESVLKVSSSCTSVYVDGSEIRGSTNATIVIKYGTYEGQAEFIVWMPEFQLDIQLSDPKLNQIKGWRVPNGLNSQVKRDSGSYSSVKEMSGAMGDSPGFDIDTSNSLRSTPKNSSLGSTPTISGLSTLVTGLLDEDEDNLDLDDDEEEDTDGEDDIDQKSDKNLDRGSRQVWDMDQDRETLGGGERGIGADVELEGIAGEDEDDLYDDDSDNSDAGNSKFHCRLRYQHSKIDVFARFMASDHESGRTSFFISKKTYLKVTDLVSDYLRLSDTQVAIIKGSSRPYIQGLSPGRTEVQVVSPVTGRVLGTKDVRVVNEKVTITSMKVQVISGVQLSLFPDTDSENEFIAETTITSKLSAKYQEALLEIQLRFSDNSWIKLDEVDRENYILAVDSLDPNVVELPPIQNSKYPRILAVSEGGGPIMRVSLELNDQCHRSNSQPLAMSVAEVQVNFTTSPNSRSEFTQNDSNQGLGVSKHTFRKQGRTKGDRNSNSNFKKDSNGGSSSYGLVNDITGIPLKDDSSRASRPLQHLDSSSIPVGFGPDKGWTFSPRNTPLEVAMYVLLGVFSVAILVFVASCVVYASRVKKREISTHPEGLLGMDIKFSEHAGFGGTATLLGHHLSMPRNVNPGPSGLNPTTNAHDWVWLGRASLALHPSLDGNKHSSQNSNRSTSFESSHNGGGPMRIIANPNFENLRLASQLQQPLLLGSPMHGNGHHSTAPIHGGEDISPNQIFRPPQNQQSQSQIPPPRPPKPNSNQSSLSHNIDSTTFSVKQLTPMSPGKPSPVSQDYKPPVPPHRNIKPGACTSPVQHQKSIPSPPRSSISSTKSNKSNSNKNNNHLPQHHRHHSSHSNNSTKSKQYNNNNNNNSRVVTSSMDDDELPNPASVDFEFDQDYENDGHGGKRVNLVGNPMCFIDEEEDGDGSGMDSLAVAAGAGAAARQNHRVKNHITDNVKLNMDYDQLMEYFDSLKETEA